METNNLTLNQLPPQTVNSQPEPQQATREPAQQAETITENNNEDKFISVDNFLSNVHTEARLSADSVAVEQPDGSITIDTPTPSASVDAKPQLTESEALKNARVLMEMRESVQSFGLAWWVDGSASEYKQYLYPDNQKERLSQAWAPIIQQNNLHVSPWANIAVTELMCTGPLLTLAHNNRKYRQALQAALAKNKQLENQLKNVTHDNPRFTAPSGKRWEVDYNGFFTGDQKGKYVAEKNRKEKPDFSDSRTLPLLVEHNGAEKIKQIYGDI